MAQRINFNESTNLGGVADPTLAQDAVTKKYVDNLTLEALSDVQLKKWFEIGPIASYTYTGTNNYPSTITFASLPSGLTINSGDVVTLLPQVADDVAVTGIDVEVSSISGNTLTLNTTGIDLTYWARSALPGRLVYISKSVTTAGFGDVLISENAQVSSWRVVEPEVMSRSFSNATNWSSNGNILNTQQRVETRGVIIESFSSNEPTTGNVNATTSSTELVEPTQTAQSQKTLTLPASIGTAGQVLAIDPASTPTTSAAQLKWVNQSGGGVSSIANTVTNGNLVTTVNGTVSSTAVSIAPVLDSFTNIAGNLVTNGAVSANSGAVSVAGDVRSTITAGLVIYFAGSTQAYTVGANVVFQSNNTNFSISPVNTSVIASGTNIGTLTKTAFTDVAAGTNTTMSVSNGVLTVNATQPTVNPITFTETNGATVATLSVSNGVAPAGTLNVVAGANTYWDNDTSGNLRINSQLPTALGKGWIVSIGVAFDTAVGGYPGWTSSTATWPRFKNDGTVVATAGIQSSTYLGANRNWNGGDTNDLQYVANTYQAWNNSFSDALQITLAQVEDFARFTVHTAPLGSGVNPSQTDAVVQGLFGVNNPNAGPDYINGIQYDDGGGTYEYQRAAGGTAVIIPTLAQVLTQGNTTNGTNLGLTGGSLLTGSSANYSFSDGTSGQVLTKGTGNTLVWASASGSGTVTSVAVANGGGLSVSGSPITSNGTITVKQNSWDYYTCNYQTDGVSTMVTSPQAGTRYTYTQGSNTVYRFVSTAKTGLYPSVDAYYSDQALTTQLIQRGA